MNRLVSGTAVLALSLGLIACTDNGSSDMSSTVDFTAFVIAEVGNTSEGRDAVSINDIDFSFNDQENEQAFAELF
ncbi:MAG: hypothetical protein WD071_08215 [Pseudohongiella sp.]|uniref:hypothetical protein n=1 Tax=Gammaproteobacteria TaxID=1236 RepID=UPI00349FF2AB